MSDELLNGEQRAPELGAQQDGASAGAAGAAERGRSPSAAEPAAPAEAPAEAYPTFVQRHFSQGRGVKQYSDVKELHRRKNVGAAGSRIIIPL